MLKRTSNRFTWSSLQYVVTDIVRDGLPNSQQAQKAIAKQGVFPMQNLTLHIYPIPTSSIPFNSRHDHIHPSILLQHVQATLCAQSTCLVSKSFYKYSKKGSPQRKLTEQKLYIESLKGPVAPCSITLKTATNLCTSMWCSLQV